VKVRVLIEKKNKVIEDGKYEMGKNRWNGHHMFQIITTKNSHEITSCSAKKQDTQIITHINVP